VQRADSLLAGHLIPAGDCDSDPDYFAGNGCVLSEGIRVYTGRTGLEKSRGSIVAAALMGAADLDFGSARRSDLAGILLSEPCSKGFSMNKGESSLELRVTISNEKHLLSKLSEGAPGRVAYLIYALTLFISISMWLIVVRAPLWHDETVSYWQISSGFSQIWPRQFASLVFPSYAYILWFSTKLIGTSELALRMPSIVAMLAATYFLYLAARDMLGREDALVAAIAFALNPIVMFESIDVRPYAFGVLVINVTIFVLLRMRKSHSLLLAALFGLLTASHRLCCVASSSSRRACGKRWASNSQLCSLFSPWLFFLSFPVCNIYLILAELTFSNQHQSYWI
jgi:hypothetical protein